MSSDAGPVVRLLPQVQQMVRFSGGVGAPNIEAPSSAVSYDTGDTHNKHFEDHTAFQNNFVEETQSLAELQKVLEEGQTFVSVLYTYRSCSKALPMVQQDTSDGDRSEIHRRSFQILRPEIRKMKSFMEFQETAIKVFVSTLRNMVKPEQKKEIHSDQKVELMIKLLDLLVVLDALKDMKASLLNDFSRFKRSFSAIRAELDDSDVISEEIHNLQMFLGNPQHPKNLIIFNLKTDIHKIGGFEDVMVMLVSYCCDMLEKEMYLMADEKHRLLRTVPYIIFLIDSHDPDGLNVFKLKKLDLGRVRKLYKYMPILPLYGDMKISIQYILAQAKHWTPDMEAQWVTDKAIKLAKHYELKYIREQIRAQYNSYAVEFTMLMNGVKQVQRQGAPVDPDRMQSIFDTVKRGFKLLNAWKAKVIEQTAFKYENPVTEEEYRRRGGKGDAGAEYEKVLRFNYSPEETYALVDVIGMIKGLGALMMKNATELVPLLHQFVHDDVQDFVQKQVARPLRKAHKRKRAEVKQTLLDMRDLVGDWINRDEQIKDYESKKEVLVKMNRDFPRRATAPTSTQISLLRRMTNTIFNTRSAGMQGGFFSEKDLKNEWVPVWEAFYDRSYYYTYIISYQQTLNESMELSFLWFREFYLEMTNCVQFEIHMSMPWILTEFIIKTPSIKENLFYPVDIYNDAAHKALAVLRQQFLYDEIEAEVNLAFDQLVFGLSDEVFKYYKTLAASLLIDKPFRDSWQQLKGSTTVLKPISSRYETLMQQRNVQLLGRSVDLQMLITHHINSNLRRNVDLAISKFEASELTGIVELRELLQNCRMTHKLLSQHLPIDSFEDMFDEINENTQVGTFRGRIVLHIVSELQLDFIPNFVYCTATQRFVRSNVIYVEPIQRDPPPRNVATYMYYGRGFRSAVEGRNQLFRGFFGSEHMEALLDVLDYTELPLVISETLNGVQYTITQILAEYSNALHDGLQPMKLPQLMYGVIGAYGFFDLKLKPIIEYPSLRSVVFQSLREIGNSFCFLALLEQVAQARENLSFNQIAHFLGVQTNPTKSASTAPGSSDEDTVPQAAFIRPPHATWADVVRRTVDALSGSVDPRQLQSGKSLANDAEALYRPVLEPRSLSAAVVRFISGVLDRSVRKDWTGPPPDSSGNLEVEKPRDFVRLYSSLQFIFCSPGNTDPQKFVDDPAAFGDGWCWGGCLLIHLLGLKHRFEFMDFNLHIMKINEIDPLPTEQQIAGGKKGKKGGATSQVDVAMVPAVTQFLREARYVAELNEYIFSFMEVLSPAPLPEPVYVAPEGKEAYAPGAHMRQISTMGGVIRAGAGPGASAPHVPAHPASAGGPPPPPPPS